MADGWFDPNNKDGVSLGNMSLMDALGLALGGGSYLAQAMQMNKQIGMARNMAADLNTTDPMQGPQQDGSTVPAQVSPYALLAAPVKQAAMAHLQMLDMPGAQKLLDEASIPKLGEGQILGPNGVTTAPGYLPTVYNTTQTQQMAKDYLAPDGNGGVARLPGYDRAMGNSELSKALGQNMMTLGADGIAPIPGAVSAQSAFAGGKAGAEAGARFPYDVALANVRALSDARYRPVPLRTGDIMSPDLSNLMGVASSASPTTAAAGGTPAGGLLSLGGAFQPPAPQPSPQQSQLPATQNPAAPAGLGGSGVRFTQLPGGGTVAINNSGPQIAGDTELSKITAEQMKPILADANDAQQALQQLQVMKANAPSAIFGLGDEARLDMRKLGQQIGFLGVGPNDPAIRSSEEIDKASNALSNTLGSRSDSALAVAQKSIPNRSNSQAGFLGNISSVEQRAQRAIDRRDAAQDFLAKNGNLNGFAEQFDNTNPPSMYSNRVTGQADSGSTPTLSSAPTNADLQHTAMKYGLSVDQVKQRLGMK